MVVIRVIRHYTGVTGPETYEAKYETKDFHCPEMEAFIQGVDATVIQGATYGFTGIEIVGDAGGG